NAAPPLEYRPTPRGRSLPAYHDPAKNAKLLPFPHPAAGFFAEQLLNMFLKSSAEPLFMRFPC
ncbi:MAG: hypothetical protein WC076_11280, partial [Terrimicrobiaceae bacterium]